MTEPCVQLPTVPTIPAPGFTLSPPQLPSFDLGVDFCCKLQLAIVPPPIPIGPLVLAIPGAAAALASLNAYVKAINVYIESIPLSCPFDDQATD